MSIHRSQRERSTGRLTRRRFLAGTAAAAASPWLVPASALGKDGATAAGDRITIGVLGVGNRGNSSIDALYPLPDAQVVAIADPRRERRLWTQDQVNATYAKRENKATYKACDAYHDFRELLARPDIDAVWGCVPDHWHGVLYNRVLEAGKDMYGEKPVTRWIGQGVTVCQAVRRYGRVFQTGTQQRSTWQFRHACELARAGYLGKVHTVLRRGSRRHDLRRRAAVRSARGIRLRLLDRPRPDDPVRQEAVRVAGDVHDLALLRGLHHELGRPPSGHRRLGMPRDLPQAVRGRGQGRAARGRHDRHVDRLADGRTAGPAA